MINIQKLREENWGYEVWGLGLGHENGVIMQIIAIMLIPQTDFIGKIAIINCLKIFI